MKKLAALAGSIVLLSFLTGCEAPGAYGGGYAGVYGEYPQTYYGAYENYPVYTPYPRHYHYYAPYDRDHYWDRDRHWGRYEYRHEHHEHHDDD